MKNSPSQEDVLQTRLQILGQKNDAIHRSDCAIKCVSQAEILIASAPFLRYS